MQSYNRKEQPTPSASNMPSITLSTLIDLYPEAPWDFCHISRSSHCTFDIVLKYRHRPQIYQFDWDSLSMKYDEQYVSYPDMPWIGKTVIANLDMDFILKHIEVFKKDFGNDFDEQEVYSIKRGVLRERFSEQISSNGMRRMVFNPTNNYLNKVKERKWEELPYTLEQVLERLSTDIPTSEEYWAGISRIKAG